MTGSVRKLTQALFGRRELDGRVTLLLVSLGFGLCGGASAQTVGDWHDPADIGHVAEAFLLQRVTSAADDTTVRAGMLDGRLRLAACDRELQAFLRPGTRITAKTIVGVRCEGSRPWRLFVPVEIAVRTQVWTTGRPLPRGHLLTREDLVAEVRDVSRMNSGYISNVESLIGQRLRSSVLAGRALTMQLVEADNVIQRGQSVTLAVASGGINIRMTGKALMDGALHERIRVENLNSGRVVEGIVRSRELVEVLMPQARSTLTSSR